MAFFRSRSWVKLSASSIVYLLCPRFESGAFSYLWRTDLGDRTGLKDDLIGRVAKAISSNAMIIGTVPREQKFILYKTEGYWRTKHKIEA